MLRTPPFASPVTPVVAWLRTLSAMFLLCCPALPAAAHLPLDEQATLLAEAVTEDPKNAEIYSRQAAIFLLQEHWDEAATAYLHAAAFGGDRDAAEVGVARALFGAGLVGTAETLLDSVVHRSPGGWMGLIARARVRRAGENTGGAADDFLTGVVSMKRPEPGLVVEAMNAQVEAGRSENALKLADAAAGKIGPVVSIELPAIELERSLGRPRAALARVDRLLLQAPKHELWLALRGEILEEVGDTEAARTTYEEVLILIAARPEHRRNEKLRELERQLQQRLAEQADKSTPESVGNGARGEAP